jgi:hypothetical protein
MGLPAPVVSVGRLVTRRLLYSGPSGRVDLRRHTGALSANIATDLGKLYRRN